MTTSSTPATAFPPLPVRRRDVLEIFDTAIKLYRRYYVVLLAWAAFVHVAPAFLGVAISYLLPDLLPLYTFGAFCIQLFVQPILIGVVACCIAGAVRGQTVTLKQCWTFFRPRYWPTVGQYIMTRILALVGWLVVVVGITIIWSLTIVFAATELRMPTFVNVLGGIVYFVISLAIISVVGSVLTASMMITPIVVCLEDDKRGGEAQTRAWQLFKSNWLRITWLYSLLGLAVLATVSVVFGLYTLWAGIDGLKQAMDGLATNAQTPMDYGAILAIGNMFYMPLVYLCSAVLYLDLRVRREALDLEWSAHVSAPPRPPVEAGLATAARPRLEPETTPSGSSFGGPAPAETAVRPTFEELPHASGLAAGSAPLMTDTMTSPVHRPADEPVLAPEPALPWSEPEPATVSGDSEISTLPEPEQAAVPTFELIAVPEPEAERVEFSGFGAVPEPAPVPEPAAVPAPEPVPVQASVPAPEPVPLPEPLSWPPAPTVLVDVPLQAPTPPAAVPPPVLPRYRAPASPPAAPHDDDFNPSSFG